MIKKMKWDSDFFEKNIYELTVEDINEMASITEDSFFQIKVPSYDLESKIILESNYFIFVDSHKEYYIESLELIDINDDSQVSIEYGGDKNLEKNSGEIFVENSRFNIYAEKSKVIDFYNKWIEKSKYGNFDDEYLLFIFGNQEIGFSTLRYLSSNTVRIGLFGIFSDFQGKGYSKLMILKLLNELKKRNISKVLVATQGKNILAQKLYESVGFQLNSTEDIYYKKIGE